MLLVTLSLLLGFGVYAFSSCRDPRVLIPVFLGGIILVAIWIIVRFVRVGDFEFVAHVVFPVVLCTLCVANAVFFTPACVPDEEYHYKKTYSMANVFMGDMSPHEMRNEDIAFNHNTALFNGNVEARYWNNLPNVELHATQEGHQANIPKDWLFEPGVDLPQFRLPAMLGIMMGKTLGLSGYVTFLLGRLFNAFYAVALIVLAVRLAPVGRNALMAVSLLPMCLHLFGSFSYDAANIGLGLLTTALLLRLHYGKDQVSLRLMVGFVLCATLLAPGKIVYVTIGLLGVLVPTSRFSSKRVAVCFKVATVLVPVAFAALLGFTRVTTTLAGHTTDAADTLDHRGKQSGTFYTLDDLIGHPVESVAFLLKSLVLRAPSYVGSLLGGSLGWFQQVIRAPIWLDVLILLSLLLGVPRAEDDDRALSRTLRIGCLIASTLGILGIMLSMWTGWTFTTDEYIHGVQGRYFLPYAPGIMLVMRPKSISAPRPLGSAIVMSFVSLDFLYLAHIFQAVMLA